MLIIKEFQDSFSSLKIFFCPRFLVTLWGEFASSLSASEIITMVADEFDKKKDSFVFVLFVFILFS